MKDRQNKFSPFSWILTAIIAFSFLGSTVSYAQSRTADEQILAVEMAARLETMLEKIIGKDRCLAKVSVQLNPPSSGGQFISGLSRMSGVVIPKQKSNGTKINFSAGFSTIRSIGVTLYLDNKLSKDKIEEVKAAVPKLMELDYSRGDSLKIELILWRELPPENLGIKQLSFLEKNLWVIIAIAIIIIIGFILLLFLFMPTRKIIKERAKIKPQEPQKMPDFEKLIEDLKSTLTKPGQEGTKNLDKVMEDIREALVKSPTKTDDLLTEIKGALDTMAERLAVVGSGGASGAGAAAATSPEFISALKEALSPATAAGTQAAGPGMSPEILTTLQKIQDLMRQQVETIATGSKVLDEPFKYLDTLSNREISLYIEGETPRMAAIILGHIDVSKSTEIVSSLPDDKKLQLSEAMASLEEKEEVATEMKDFIQRKMPQVKLRADFSPIVGNKALAAILSALPYNQTTAILSNMEKNSPELADTVKNEMFLFEDIARLDNRTMQEIIKTLDKDRLALALSRATDEIKQKFFGNMTEQAATILKEDIETLAPAPKEEGKEEIKIKLFEDIVNLDNKTMQKIFKLVDKDTLKVALKGTSDEIRGKIYSMMTERAAAMLKEDIDVMSPIPRDRAEEAHKTILAELENLEKQPLVAQKEIIEKILELEKAGRVSIRKGKQL